MELNSKVPVRDERRAFQAHAGPRVGAGDNVFLADEFSEHDDAIGYHFRVLDEVGGASFRATHRQVSLSGLQRNHINHKAVFHITFQHALIRFVDILILDHFDI